MDTNVTNRSRDTRHRTSIIFLLLILTVLPGVSGPAGTLAAAGSAESADAVSGEEPTYRTITDGLGREVAIPAEPARIVTAGRAVMMIANVLWAFDDAPDRVIGVGRISQGRGNFLPRIDPGYDEIIELAANVGPEQVASLAPDLVILKSVVRSNLGEPLERLGIPVIYVDLENPEQYQRDLAVLGAAVSEETRAGELQRYYREAAAAVTEATDALASGERPETLLLYYRSTGGEVAFNVPPAAWIQTRIVEMAGGAPVWREANPGGGWGTVNFEQIAAWDPEVIILVGYNGRAREVREQLQKEPRWQELRAVRDRRFHAMPLDHYSWDQPDVRWILGLQWTAAMLQSELFADLDLEQATRDFYRILYRLDRAMFDEIVAPTLSGDFPGGSF